MILDFYTGDNPPIPADPQTRARWKETALRARLLEGEWGRDLLERYLQHMGLERADAHGAYTGGLDKSCNPFKAICTELSQLYHEPPDVFHVESSADVLINSDTGALARSMLWPMMEWFQSMVLGCREYLIRVDASRDDGLIFRPVSPAFIDGASHPDKPHEPIRIDEYRQRAYRGQVIWTIDRYDITDPENPIYQILAPHVVQLENAGITKQRRAELDITADILDAPQSGADYPYRKADGAPILPWVLYHAKVTLDRLWLWADGLETVDGSINSAVIHSFIMHAIRTSSWPQKYGINVIPVGASTAGTEDTPRRTITADPASVLLFKPANSGMESPMQGVLGQWNTGADIQAMIAALDNMVNRIATDSGIPANDVARQKGTARSGYAISLSNASKRVAQDRHRIGFKAHDERLCAVAATLWNRAHGTALPEDGYSVAHKPIPLSPQELAERRKNLIELMANGLISRLDAYLELHPGFTQPQAEADLMAIDRERMIR